MRVTYLDTNHVSRLARSPSAEDSRGVLRLLEHGDFCLGFTMIHVQELSDPGFRSRREVGRLLDQLPVAWAPSPDRLYELEVQWGIERAQTGVSVVREIFSTSFVTALSAPPEADIPVSEMLEAMAENAHLRSHLEDAADYGSRMDDRFKRAAAVVRAPHEPLLARVRDLNTTSMSSDEVVRRAGGPTAFPACNVADGLARTRAADERFTTETNDLFDEWHAAYSPYCVAMPLDRGTAGRLRSTRLASASRVTFRLEDIVSIARANARSIA